MVHQYACDALDRSSGFFALRKSKDQKRGDDLEFGGDIASLVAVSSLRAQPI
jgi:hypothetical protein